MGGDAEQREVEGGPPCQCEIRHNFSNYRAKLKAVPRTGRDENDVLGRWRKVNQATV